MLSRAGVGSRREVEDWIRAGRVTVNDRPAELGMRAVEGDEIRLDGRLIRLHRTRGTVFLCHRSPGEPLREPHGDEQRPALAERLPRAAGRRFIAVSPMPHMDGGLEILSSDGELAAELQKRVRGLPVEFSLRVRGEIGDVQRDGLLQGETDRGVRLDVRSIEAAGGEGANRWYQLAAVGVAGRDLRQLVERQGISLGRALRTKLGSLVLDRTLARGQARELTAEELQQLLAPQVTDSPASAP